MLHRDALQDSHSEEFTGSSEFCLSCYEVSYEISQQPLKIRFRP